MAPRVEVKVLYFASARECAGAKEEVVAVEGSDGAPPTTAQLEQVLLERHPKLRAIFASTVFAVNMNYVDKVRTRSESPSGSEGGWRGNTKMKEWKGSSINRSLELGD